MTVQTSSLLGANLGGVGDSTALFALGSVAYGTGGSEWQYVQVTSTHVTGKVVIINQNGTAKVALPAMTTGNATAACFGFVQNSVNQGEYCWVATRGRGLYVLTSASFTAGGDTTIGVGLSANSGRLIQRAAAADGSTMFGVVIISSVGTADYTAGVPTLATLIWPRTALQG